MFSIIGHETFGWGESLFLLRRRVALVFLLLSTAAVFCSVLGFSLIQLDDPKHIWENPLINPPQLSKIPLLWLEPYFGMYIPVTYSTWALTAWFSMAMTGKIAPAFFHGTNLALHLLNTALVFSLLLKLVPAQKWRYEHTLPLQTVAALLGSFIFALHPMQVESIAWISCLKDLLSCFFSLLCVHGFINWTRGEKRAAWGATLFLVLAVLSKPNAVITPLLCVLFSLLVTRKIERRTLYLVSVWILALFPWVLFSKTLQPNSELNFVTPMYFRPLVAMDAFGFYLTQFFFPFKLGIDYGRSPSFVIEKGWQHLYWVLPILSLVLVGAVKKPRWAAIGLGLFFTSTLPVLGFVPFLFQMFSTVTDHYAYTAMLGGSVLAASVVLVKPRLPQTIAVAVFVLVLSGKSYLGVGSWKNGVHIFTQSVSVNPNSLLAHNNLGVEYQSRSQYRQAATYFKKALELAPERGDLYSNLGAALVSAGETRQGIYYLHLAEEKAKTTPIALYNLARAYLRLGNTEKARRYATKAKSIAGQSALPLDPFLQALEP